MKTLSSEFIGCDPAQPINTLSSATSEVVTPINKVTHVVYYKGSVTTKPIVEHVEINKQNGFALLGALISKKEDHIYYAVYGDDPHINPTKLIKIIMQCIGCTWNELLMWEVIPYALSDVEGSFVEEIAE